MMRFMHINYIVITSTHHIVILSKQHNELVQFIFLVNKQKKKIGVDKVYVLICTFLLSISNYFSAQGHWYYNLINIPSYISF